MSGKFLISLDFELEWGVFDTYGNKYLENLKGTRYSIEQILNFFQKYKIRASWAIVGLLFNENKNDFHKYKPFKTPTYKNINLNPFLSIIGDSEKDDPFHYAFSLIDKINKTSGQEIASHSYSHYNCLEKGQNKMQFDSDIRSAVKIAKDKFNIELKSFVFPKNQINKNYLEILKKYEFKVYRDTVANYSKNNFINRILRFIDSYLFFRKLPKNINRSGYLVSTLGNRFLRPYINPLLNYFMLRKIKSEMRYAALNNEIYHLWWHPHNFGKNTKKNLNNLEVIIKYYIYLKKNYKFKSINMRDIIK